MDYNGPYFFRVDLERTGLLVPCRDAESAPRAGWVCWGRDPTRSDGTEEVRTRQKKRGKRGHALKGLHSQEATCRPLTRTGGEALAGHVLEPGGGGLLPPTFIQPGKPSPPWTKRQSLPTGVLKTLIQIAFTGNHFKTLC